MSKQAEEIPLKIYVQAKDGKTITLNRVFDDDICYIRKDATLNWEDIELLYRLFAEEGNNFSMHDKYFYTEVLNRFNKSKEERK